MKNLFTLVMVLGNDKKTRRHEDENTRRREGKTIVSYEQHSNGAEVEEEKIPELRRQATGSGTGKIFA
ncbi:MAG: hypothetical protein IJ607_01815 [Bacteroidaceae bacterium]|nr:hypothetical protein [Bacteroidaceae bacterium]